MPEATNERHNPRKLREGLVVSTKMDKTVVVAVVDRVRHRGSEVHREAGYGR